MKIESKRFQEDLTFSQMEINEMNKKYDLLQTEYKQVLNQSYHEMSQQHPQIPPYSYSIPSAHVSLSQDL